MPCQELHSVEGDGVPWAWAGPERLMTASQLQSAGLVGRAVAMHQRGQAGQAGQAGQHAHGSLAALQPEGRNKNYKTLLTGQNW